MPCTTVFGNISPKEMHYIFKIVVDESKFQQYIRVKFCVKHTILLGKSTGKQFSGSPTFYAILLHLQRDVHCMQIEQKIICKHYETP